MTGPTEPRVARHDDRTALVEGVADALVERLVAAQATGTVPQLVLTGGSVADDVHRALARRAGGGAVDWSRVELWWGDERFVAPDDGDRNAGQARAALLDVVDVDPDRVHEMPSTADATDVEAGAAAYSSAVREHGGGEFDVVMLGIGEDAHVASLFPGHPALEVDDRVAVGVTGSPKPPPERVSLTLGALNRSRAVWVVAAGAGKADAVAQVLGGDTALPAARVHGRDETVFWLDAEAAARLRLP